MRLASGLGLAGAENKAARRGSPESLTGLLSRKHTELPAFRPGVQSPLVEAGGQSFHRFRGGLDYAFIRAAAARMRSVLSRCTCGILVPAQDWKSTASL